MITGGTDVFIFLSDLSNIIIVTCGTKNLQILLFKLGDDIIDISAFTGIVSFN
jgi:hypothetical protein